MHTFRITDDNHCSLDLTYEMSTNTGLALSWEEEDLVRCPGEEFISLDLQISTTDFHLRIDDGDTFGPLETIPLSQGVHRLSVWDGNCRIDTTFYVTGASQVRLDPPLPEVVYISTENSFQFMVNPDRELTNPRWVFKNDEVS